MCMRLFRDRELAELKKHLQALGDDGAGGSTFCKDFNEIGENLRGISI